MKELFQENKNALLMLLTLLFVLIFAVYFIFFRPLSLELEQKVNQEQNLQHEIDLLEAEIQLLGTIENNNEDDIESIHLERKVPRLPELESLLLTLNEMELVSETLISNMSFGYQGSLPEREQNEENEDENQAENEIENGVAEETATDIAESESIDEQLPSIEFIEIPDGLQPVVVTLDIEAPSYDQFQLLLKEIEKQERLMIVTDVNFNHPGEYELIIAEEIDETILATLDITTFYYDK